MSNPWLVPANLVKLADLWMDGRSASQIAEVFNVSRNSIIGKVHRMGLQRDVDKTTLTAAQRAGHGLVAKPTHYAAPAKAPKAKPAPKRIPPKAGIPIAAAVVRRFQRDGVPLPPCEPDRLREVASLHARPWLTRKFGECNWPVSGEGADTYSCCAPEFRAGWCKGHFRIGTVPSKTSVKRLEHQFRKVA